ncbi:hypothetical protein MMC12_005679 [Toensbergia leucococca]|nr:hypothetical protein [Toensbergia leucococca]
MDSLLRLLHLDRVVTQPQRPAILQRPATPPRPAIAKLFECLPAELIHQIAAWLPPSSAASLSLCNHKLHITLGKQSLQNLHQSYPIRLFEAYKRDSLERYNQRALSEAFKRDSLERYNQRALFLQALDRDLPETLYCFICNRLHVLIQGHEAGLEAEELYRRVSKKHCQRGDSQYNKGTAYTYHAGFKFEHVQMAMKLRRRGLLPDAKAYLTSLAILRPARGPITFLPEYMGLYLFEPRFVDDQLSVRAQSWILIPEEQGSIMPKTKRMTVCAHLNESHFHVGNLYTMAFRCKLNHLADKQDSCDKCRSLIRCNYCPTEVRVEAKRLASDSKGGFLIITKWQALGCGRSPSEAHWITHLESPNIPVPYLPDCAPGSIQAGYEDQPGIKHDSLLTVAKAWELLNKKMKCDQRGSSLTWLRHSATERLVNQGRNGHPR